MKRECTLIISHACNLHCIYCYEHFKSGRKMEFETARDIIKKERENLDRSNYDGLDFLFMGGEPLTNYTLIKQVCEWARVLEDVHFRIITNGTLFTKEIKEWFEKNATQITVDLSVDGIDDTQQTNRGCNTYELPIEWVHKHWPENRFKMTVSRESLPTLSKSLVYLENQGYPTLPTLAVGASWTPDDAKIYSQQLEAISAYYLSNQSLRVPSFLLRSIDSLFNENMITYKSCETGDTSITYDTDGKVYPCVMFSPLVLPPDDKKWKHIDFSDKSLFEDEDCLHCVIKNMCKTCYGFNYKYRGNIHSRDKSLCAMYKAEIRAICSFQLRFIEKRALMSSLTEKEKERYERCSILYGKLEG